MKFVFVGAAVAALLSVHPAVAGQQTCGGRPVDRSVRTCPDGSLPIYQAEILSAAPARPQPQPQQLQPQRQPQYQPQAQPQVQRQVQAPAADAGDLVGVWHTAVSGGVWQSPSAVPGWDLLHISPGVRAGDLTIDPSGRYVWNSYGGKVGQWVPGDGSYPVVLIDTVERKKWKVGPDPRHPDRIFIWDGLYTYIGSR